MSLASALELCEQDLFDRGFLDVDDRGGGVAA